MAWQVAGYSIAAAALVAAAAIAVVGTALTRMLVRLQRTAVAVGEQAEASLRQCERLAEEAKEAAASAKTSLDGFAALAEGARAVGDAVQSAARTAAGIADHYRELLAPFVADGDDERTGRGPERPDAVGTLLRLWRSRFGGDRRAEGRRDGPGADAEHAKGE